MCWDGGDGSTAVASWLTYVPSNIEDFDSFPGTGSYVVAWVTM